MLGLYERRHFKEYENVWLGRYQNLANVLHWHFECEIIRIHQGQAQIKIGDLCFDGFAGDCFFCGSEQLHYIISQPDTLVDIAILNRNLTHDIVKQYDLSSPKLAATIPVGACFDRIKKEQSQKGLFYQEAINCYIRELLIQIFRCSPTQPSKQTANLYHALIRKINEEYAFITFADAARYCGYCHSHFSKVFTKLSGMTFSEYLNIIRVEHAITFLCSQSDLTIGEISMKCGFSTVRNFNRVFKKLTGYSPRELPEAFTIDTGLRIEKGTDFDPTNKNAILM